MRPRVTLVHGFLGSPADWADLLSALESGIDCDCVSLRRDLDCSSVAHAAETLAKRLAARPSELLVGYSLGGRIALECAASQQLQGSRVLLLSTSPGIDPSVDGASARDERAKEDDARAARLRADGIESFIDAWYWLPLFASFRSHQSFAEACLRRTDSSVEPDAEFWASCVAGCSPGRTVARWSALAELASRTTLAVGAQDERYAALAQRAQRAAPNLRVHTIENAGHVLPLEAPAECARLIESFLREKP